MENQYQEWIFRKVSNPEQEELMKKVEMALGFKLFIWQKTYIQGEGFRRYGATTAEIIRDLLQSDKAPLDFSRPSNIREDIYKRELYEIKEKLDQAGIPTRTVFFSQKEKEAYFHTRKEGSRMFGSSGSCGREVMDINSYNWEDLYQKAEVYIREYVSEATVNKGCKVLYGGKPRVEVSFPYKGNKSAMIALRSDPRYKEMKGYNVGGNRMVRGEVIFSIDGKLNLGG